MEASLQRGELVGAKACEFVGASLQGGNFICIHKRYLVDSKWFKQWKKYVGYDSWDMYNVGQESVFPGPVDNSPLLNLVDGNAVLKEELIDDLDYVLVPTTAWEKLVVWYNIKEGQEPIARKVVEHGMFVKHCKVEVYLMELKLCKNSNQSDCVSKQFSKADTIETIENVMRDVFNISEKTEIRIWNKYMSNTYEQLAKKDNTIQEAGLYQGQVLVVEQKNEDGSWPRQATLTNSYTSSSSSSNRSSSSGSSSRGGFRCHMKVQNRPKIQVDKLKKRINELYHDRRVSKEEALQQLLAILQDS